MAGLQCPLLLWYLCNDSAAVPGPDASGEARLEEGKSIGEYAKKRYPSGVEVEFGDFKKTIAKTQELLGSGQPIFEASFMNEECYCRCDILVPNDGMWDIIEVKSSTSVKEEHIEDVAFQKWVLERCGIAVRHCHVMFVNNEYVRGESVDEFKLLRMQDITNDVDERISSVTENVAMMLRVINGEKPTVPIGAQCTKPRPCPMMKLCWAFLPEDNVTQLYYDKKIGWELLSEGVRELREVPVERVSGKHLIQIKCVSAGKPYVDAARLSKWLSRLQAPVSFLDFETFNEAIPRFEGVRAYEQLVFQYSLHVANGEHTEYLAESGDKREEFLKHLKKDLPESGSIVVYNQSFEVTRLRELASIYPSYGEWVEGVIERMVDLLVPFRNFWYYHPKQKGSCSMKAVLPALTGISYSDLEISDGESAAREYLRVMYGDVSSDEKEKVRESLLQYCGLDTEGMVWIVEKLHKELIAVKKNSSI